MEAKATLCTGTTLEVLHQDNYLSWSVRLKTYLISQDLWNVIDSATDSQKEEDYKATLRARIKKNFKALHVIQNSCGPEFFYEIRKITSAKTAWYKLEEIYNNMPTNTNSVVQELLGDDNYEHWSAQVKAYLMAYDLWDIVTGTTEPPKQEDDEFAFKTWRKKNCLALHVIQKSCERHLYDKINWKTIAKDAWDELAKICNVPKRTKSVVPDLLKKEWSICNYKDWSIPMKTYLIAQDLWDIIESSIQPSMQEDGEVVVKAWTKKNLMALQVIQNSCELDISNEIKDIPLAKTAWDTLKEKYGGQYIYGFNMIYWRLKFLLDRGDWDELNRHLISNNMAALNAKVNDLGQTPLHIAVTKGHVHIVERLVELISEDDLEIQDDSGMTAMSLATAMGDSQMLHCMHQKNKKLLTIRDRKGRIPLLVALDAGNLDLFLYLYWVTPERDLIRDATYHRDSSVITALIMGDYLGLALDLLQSDNHMATLPDRNGHIPLYALACRPSAFSSGHWLVFWKKWIYALLRQQRGNLLDPLLGMSWHVYLMKEIEQALSRQLLELTCLQIRDLTQFRKPISNAIFQATREGIVEIVREMLSANPHLVEIKDEKSRTIFSLAVLCRQATIWNLLNGLPKKDRILILFGPADDSGNTILHMAATVDSSTQHAPNTNAALHMQRELQWFKEIEKITPPWMRDAVNYENMKPKEIFTRDHKEMLNEGEKWMKQTATSCTVVGALIVTIMFAVVFAVPGGYNQVTGLPMLSKDKLFMLFIIFDALSLFSSTTSVLMFLGIFTSRYAEEDFLTSLPQKMIIALSSLFFSIPTMMMAFCIALLIMLPGQSRLVIPIICLASLPVDLFVCMQFPLLVDMIKSTYGPSNIFAVK